MLTSKDGVLEIRLTARQGEATLDTVPTSVQNFLLFDYEVIRGTASNGQRSGGGLYPAPTLQVFPGERLIVHFENGLTGLTIRDYFVPQYTPKGQPVPLYPEQMTSSPINLHTHGAHISPRGNADNVMLHIPPGMSNTYIYDIPKNMPQGLYWYHCHLHGLTAAQVYAGLVGLLAVGRTDGNLPLVTERNIPIRNMALQYNFVFDRAGGLAQLNNPNWPQWVSTIIPPKEGELANGTYRSLLTPVNFEQSPPGTKFFTVWYGGPLSINNHRGQFEFIPSNLQQFTAAGSNAGSDVPADPSLPDYQRDVQFTVNGQFQPVIKSKAGQTEIWVLANVSDIAYINVQLTETATGRHPPIAIVGQDGNPYTAIHYPPTDNGTRLLIPPASRFAIAVIPAEGDLLLGMPERDGDTKTITAPGVLYTNNGSGSPPAVLGSLSVLPSAVSYFDGFFFFPTQVLARATASEPGGVTTPFVEGQPLDAYTSFVDLSKINPDVKRQILISGGFLNNMASADDPKTFVYAFDGGAFPNVPLIQPRLNSVEEWRFVNNNNDEHPIHVHVNDFQVVEYFDPTTGLRTGPDQLFHPIAASRMQLCKQAGDMSRTSGISRRHLLTSATGLGAFIWVPRFARAADPHEQMNMSPTLGIEPRTPPPPMDAPLIDPETRRSVNGVLQTTLRCAYTYRDIGGVRLYVRSYEGGSPGPTLRMKPGETLKIRMPNDFPPNRDLMPMDISNPHQFNNTNFHFHGSHSDPGGISDNVMRSMVPGETYDIEITLPKDHTKGTYWYHPHHHGSADIHVASGMVGMIVVEGDFAEVPEIAEAKERVLVLTQVVYDDRGMVETFDTLFPETATRFLAVNGQRRPTIAMRPGEVQRWRIVHAGYQDDMLLELEQHELHAIAYDGISLGAMETMKTHLILPGQRADFLIKAGDPGAYELHALPYDQGHPSPVGPLARVVVWGEPIDMKLPATLPKPPLDDIKDSELTGHRKLVFSATAPGAAAHWREYDFRIDDKKFDPTRIDQRVRLGSVEEWTILNTDELDDHVFHIHTNPFVIVKPNDKPLAKPQWRDTAILERKGGTLTFRSRFLDYTGIFMLHCHMMNHEDMGMMQTVEVYK